MDELLYYIWLTEKLSFMSPKISQAIAAFGSPKRVYQAKSSEWKSLPLPKEDWENLSDKSLSGARSTTEFCKKSGVRIMTLKDPDYPERLLNIVNPPHILYIAGTLPDIDGELCIAVVGTRSATNYGLRVAGNLSYQLAQKGVCVVSGMARGIDSYAHMGALKAAGKTVAVLGCGIDIIYPPENGKLMESIEKHGAVVTEYPPKTPPLGVHFPARNRIISALSAGVLVVEAAPKSGALITASLALEQGRDVFAVPGNIDNEKHGGTNDLIKDGAKAVSEVNDILSEYEGAYLYKIDKNNRHSPAGREKQVNGNQMKNASGKRAEVHIPDDMEADKKGILELLITGGLHIDSITEKTGLPPNRVNAILTELELEGYILALPGRNFEINTEGECE